MVLAKESPGPKGGRGRRASLGAGSTVSGGGPAAGGRKHGRAKVAPETEAEARERERRRADEESLAPIVAGYGEFSPGEALPRYFFGIFALSLYVFVPVAGGIVFGVNDGERGCIQPGQQAPANDSAINSFWVGYLTCCGIFFMVVTVVSCALGYARNALVDPLVFYASLVPILLTYLGHIIFGIVGLTLADPESDPSGESTTGAALTGGLRGFGARRLQQSVTACEQQAASARAVGAVILCLALFLVPLSGTVMWFVSKDRIIQHIQTVTQQKEDKRRTGRRRSSMAAPVSPGTADRNAQRLFPATVVPKDKGDPAKGRRRSDMVVDTGEEKITPAAKARRSSMPAYAATDFRARLDAELKAHPPGHGSAGVGAGAGVAEGRGAKHAARRRRASISAAITAGNITPALAAELGVQPMTNGRARRASISGAPGRPKE